MVGSVSRPFSRARGTKTVASDAPSQAAGQSDRADLATLPPGLADDEGGRAWRERVSRFVSASDGNDAPDVVTLLAAVDRVAAFGPAILAIRWGTTAVSIALAVGIEGEKDTAIVAWGVAIVAYTILRTLRPIRYTGDIKSLVTVLVEVVLLVLAVSMTGYWESPYVFSLLTAIIVAGFARGFGFGIRISIVCSLAISIPFLALPDASSDDLRLAAQWSASLILVGLVAGYARRISGEADRQHSLALDRLGRLADANALLYSLHRVTQTLPASLEMGDVLDTTMSRLDGLFDYDVAAIFLLDDTDTSWEVIRKEGVRLPLRLEQVALPPPLLRAVEEQTTVMVPDLQGDEGPGLSGRAGSGLYAVLPARGSVIGLLAIEARSENMYGSRDVELFRGFVEPMALAIDNARWFSRLRTVGADEERTRIARDLHDRIGQSLAYLAFELDRIVSKSGKDEDVTDDLDHLRGDVRGVIGEVRDTLYDLRTDVSESMGIADILADYGERVRARSGLDVTVSCQPGDRLPILQEREMWRIAQEAMTNAERHSEATRVTISWRCSGDRAVLEVGDNGKGFPIGKAGRFDSYGILGMRERASSIGARLDILSSEGQGTTIRCELAGV
jgi:signal transduction histidine kinase